MSLWLDPSELRVGLGCMRMSADHARDERLTLATVEAAVDGGVTVFDTARAYAPDADQLGHNERLLARALRGCGRRVRVVTKGGMARTGGGWVPDGRAKALLADCEASIEALEGLEIDLYLLHAPDPRTPFSTSVRALARIAEEGLVNRVGLSNVNRSQLDQACALAPIAAVQVALSPFDDTALRGGVVERCAELGLAVIAHSPLGGPRRVGRIARDRDLAEVAARMGTKPAEVALAWLLGVSDAIVAIPGATRPETARSAARAATLSIAADDQARLTRAFRGSRSSAAERRPSSTEQGEIVIVMGIPGSGKSRIALELGARGYSRLNRDERGGSLRELVDELDALLASGSGRIVLDNTYLSRAARSHVLEAAAAHGVATRCIWVDTPLDQTQFNLVERLLDRFAGSLPTPTELRAAARHEPGLMMPTSQMRAVRELEPPSVDEGFASVERIPFERHAGASGAGVPDAGGAGAGVIVAARTLGAAGWEEAVAAAAPEAPHLIYDWIPDGGADDLVDAGDQLRDHVSGSVEIAVCPHGGGPPSCWCRPPLPGLALAFARRHGLDLTRVTLIGVAPAHRTLARTLGAAWVGL